MAMKRFRVAEDSMRPALAPGDEVVATDSRRPRIGELVTFPHPEREGFWMVKRRMRPPRRLGPGQAWVLSDNRKVTLADSRTLGPVPLASLMPVVTRLDRVAFQEACLLLAAEDPMLGAVVDRYGPPDFWRRPPGLPTLVLFILEQQVSLESGAAVFRRLSHKTGVVSAERLLDVGPEGVRDAGITRQKTGYIMSLAEQVATGRLDLAALEKASPSEARQTLLALKGVGPWTADVYLLSALGHIDVFPVGDRALQVGTAEVLGMAAPPDPVALEILSAPWRPLRAVAARMIWHGYLARRGRVEPTHDAPPLPRA
jgi:DNA-3-methyladenine glycosylase II